MNKQWSVLKEMVLKISFLSFIVLFPFIVLIRGSVYLHEQYHFFPLASILGGFSLTLIILLLYLTFFFGPARSFKSRIRVVATILICYGGYSLLYLSSKNAKSVEVAREFVNLHPVLRLGVSTILLVDRDLIITDANRLPEDYRKMGLQQKNHSLHFRQRNGYVHALDVRTNGRSAFRNFLTKWYFRAMGFRVIRHGGTGDHIHISLLSHDHPYAY